jgi:hypothetical protein
VKKERTRVIVPNISKKTSPYPPLYPKIISTLPFQPEKNSFVKFDFHPLGE